jgi:hypothetical protein
VGADAGGGYRQSAISVVIPTEGRNLVFACHSDAKRGICCPQRRNDSQSLPPAFLTSLLTPWLPTLAFFPEVGTTDPRFVATSGVIPSVALFFAERGISRAFDSVLADGANPDLNWSSYPHYLLDETGPVQVNVG